MKSLYSTSQTRVEQKLDKFISEIQQGKRAPSVISLQTVEDLDPDDEETWKTIRKDLEDIGISVTAFDANKDFIFEWISNAVATGAFQEKAGSSPPRSVLSLDVQSSTSSLSRWVKDSSSKTVTSGMEPPKASKAKTKATRNQTIMQAEQGSSEIRAAGGTHAPAIPTRVPRFAAFLAALSQPRRGLEDALLASDLDRARKILKNPATSRLLDKQTLNDCLDWAIRATSNEVCALLIDAGADISDGRHYYPQLATAVNQGKKDLAALLLDIGADVNYPISDGFSLLKMAVCQGNRDLATFLLDRGADVNYQSSDGESLLTMALRLGYRDLAALFLDRGADVNCQSSDGKSLLTMALRQGNRDLATLLLDKGADVNYQTGDGKNYSSALRAAITKKDQAMIILLSQRGADLNAVQSDGYPTAIHQASSRNGLDIVELLIDLGADFNSPQRRCGTPLMLSIYSGCFSNAELLIKRGANIEEVNVPLKHRERKHRERLLNSHPERLFYSALHIAIYVSAPYLVRNLLRNGVGTDLQEAYDFAAQHHALLLRLFTPSTSRSSLINTTVINCSPAKELLNWETRNYQEVLTDAQEVVLLLEEQKQKPAFSNTFMPIPIA